MTRGVQRHGLHGGPQARAGLDKTMSRSERPTTCRGGASPASGRLDPPLTLVLDDIAAVAPLPELPDLLASGAEQGLATLALLRSREQARARWPHRDLPGLPGLPV